VTQILHIERGDADEVRDLELAKAITEALCKAYPNHYWVVSFTGHALIVRHVLITSIVAIETGREGFGSLLPRSKVGTVHDAQREAVKHGGALLEAFGLPRGPWNGEDTPVVPELMRRQIAKRQQLTGWRPTS
jgi:hypothetical protein